MGVRVSLVINTLNEEANIGDCIRSAQKLVDELIVVDMNSSDKTAEIARSLGACVRIIERDKFVDPHRNRAFSQASGEWILLLDADERLTQNLSARLREIAENDQADVVEVSFETHMFGRTIKYCGWQDTSRKTFFKKGFLTYPDTVVHAHPEWRGRLLSLKRQEGEIVHLNYQNINHFLTKMKDYTDGEALKLVKTGRNNTPLKGIYWGIRHFIRRYFLRMGYKDGYYGLVLCLFMGFYWFLAFCKAWELEKLPVGSSEVRSK